VVLDLLELRHAATSRRAVPVLEPAADPALTLADSLPQIVWGATADGAVDFANLAFARVTGMPKRTLSPDDWLDVVHPDDRAPCLDVWLQCVASGQPYRHEYRIWSAEHAAYHWHLVCATPVTDANGRVVRWYGNAVDIHDRKLAEQTLAERQSRLQAMLDSEPECVKVVAADGTLIDMNPAGLGLIGATDAGSVIGRPVIGLVHPEDRETFLALHERVLTGANGEAEFRIVGRRGNERRVQSNAAPLRDSDGVVRSVLSITRDVTAQRELEERLRQSQRLESVGQLTGGVAHDFNNLLTVIIGNAELLLERVVADREARSLIEMILAAANSGAELTARLLAFARRQTLRPQPVDINRLLAGMDGLLRRTLGGHIDFERVGGGGLWPAQVDASQLENAILNLCLNARDAMPDSGRLTVETANSRLDDEYALGHQGVGPGQYVMIAVSDTGQGMTPEVAARAFDPFFTTKEVGKGSGLGLSMVYGFAKQSGGHVKVYSEVGQGTTVRMYLPRAFEPASRLVRTEPSPVLVEGSESVLVVEDDQLVRVHLMGQLRHLGYRVLGASDAETALEHLRGSRHIDLLLTDVVMPGGMNGQQLANKALEIRPDLRILLTSGYAESAMVHHGRLDPGVEMLPKPYRRQELAAKVRQVLDGPTGAGPSLPI
jgi:PAS domain S-box-containing protein